MLGDKILKQDTGTLAMILPTVIATNPAAFHTRRYLANRFHIDTIVSSHDPDSSPPCFSPQPHGKPGGLAQDKMDRKGKTKTETQKLRSNKKQICTTNAE